METARLSFAPGDSVIARPTSAISAPALSRFARYGPAAGPHIRDSATKANVTRLAKF